MVQKAILQQDRGEEQPWTHLLLVMVEVSHQATCCFRYVRKKEIAKLSSQYFATTCYLNDFITHAQVETSMGQGVHNHFLFVDGESNCEEISMRWDSGVYILKNRSEIYTSCSLIHQSFFQSPSKSNNKWQESSYHGKFLSDGWDVIWTYWLAQGSIGITALLL